MLTITYAPQDAALATKLQIDLRNWAKSDDKFTVLIVILSPEAEKDRDVQKTLIDALDKGHWIVPILAQPMPLPRLIDHLHAVDFSGEYALSALIAQLNAIREMAESPESHYPMRVLTPMVRASNRWVAYLLLVLVVGMFILSLLLVGGGVVQFPATAYAQIDAQAAATNMSYVRANLPHTTQEAQNFPATIQAAPAAQRPFLIATSTAMAESTPEPTP
jgi:hypothetical protein